MHLAAIQLWQGGKGVAAIFVVEAQHGEGDTYLIGMQARIIATQQRHFHPLDGLDHLLRNQLDIMVDMGQMLGGIQQQSGAGAEAGTGFGGDDRTLAQLNGR